MIVKCGVNGEPQDASNIFVCHHCGMPVCEEHGWVVAADDAFADSATARTALPVGAPPFRPVPQQVALPPGAVPAPGRVAYPVPASPPGVVPPPPGPVPPQSGPVPPHSGPVPPQLVRPAPRAATTIPRPAMHCRDCVEKFHRGAIKRHGWVDPRQVAAGVAGPVGRP